MRAAVLFEGVVANIIEVDEIRPGEPLVESETASIGDRYDGGAFTPPPPAVPTSITRRQGRLALLSAGHLADVEAAMAALDDPTERLAAQIEYEAETWERANPWIDRTGQAVGLNSEQIDELFIAAASL